MRKVRTKKIKIFKPRGINISKSLKGRKFTIEHKEKLRQAKLANPTRYWLGKTYKASEETKNKQREANLRLGIKPPVRRGDKNNNWKGGITPKNRKIRQSLEYKLWRKSVFLRDNFCCVFCGYKSLGTRPSDIHADHIKSFSMFPELRLAIDNGRTLCINCHRKTATYGINQFNKNIL